MSDDRYVIKFETPGYPFPYVKFIDIGGVTDNTHDPRNALMFDDYEIAQMARRKVYHGRHYRVMTIAEAEAIEVAHAITSSS